MSKNMFGYGPDGRVEINDAELAAMEQQFSRHTAGASTNSTCNNINPSNCTNTTDCRGTTNSDWCTNQRVCITDQEPPLT